MKIEMEDHIAALASLKRCEDAPKHNDPFDRMLIAQAKVDNMKLLTHDSLILITMRNALFLCRKQRNTEKIKSYSLVEWQR